MAPPTKTILLVEDDTYVGRMYERTFRLHGYEPTVIDNGADAVNVLLSMPTPPDAIVLDVALPGMNGLEVLKKIRSDKKYSNIPIVVLTNSYAQENPKVFHDAGADLFLIKIETTSPILLGKIEKLLLERDAPMRIPK